MKLLSLRVEHFRCVRQAKIEFDPGLNILYGPNDLGKSSLAHAIRAALLLQTTAKEHEEFVTWHGSGEPYVELVFESEPQRIWRVRKTFGTTKAFLDESRNGVDFTLETRGREVEGRLSDILRWGLAAPGGKGRPKGMPMTFLSTVLLAEQDRVEAIFDDHALGKDSDESGKKQLIEALQAMAEDPLFKTVLARVQERVDKAFNKTGGRRTGKDSPWVKLREDIQQKQDRDRVCQQEMQKTEALEIEIRQLRNRRLESQEAVDQAKGLVQRLEEDFDKEKRQQEIMARLQERKARLAEITKQLKELADAERLHEDSIRQVASLAMQEETAQVALTKAGARAQAAKDELARLQSDDRASERKLKQSTLEARRADLRTEQARNQAIETAAVKVQILETGLNAHVESVAELRKKHQAATKAREEIEAQESELRAARSLLRYHTAYDELQQAERGLEQLNGWRDQAGEKRAAAAALEAARPNFALPTSAQLDDLRSLESDRRVASAKLNVGLSVTVRPKRALGITVQSDGEPPAQHELSNAAFEAGARRQMRVDIDDVAEIGFSGGPRDARKDMDQLDRRWVVEAESVLQAAQATSLEVLARIVNDATRCTSEIQTARRDAAQLEQRIGDQPDWTAVVAERKLQLAAAEKTLGDADRSKLEKAARRLRIAGVADAEKRLELIRTRLNVLADDENKRNSNVAAANALVAERQKGLDEARSGVEGNWQETLKRVRNRQTGIQNELKGIEEEIQRLASTGEQNLAAAQKALDISMQGVACAETGRQKALSDLDEAKLLQATNAGVLKTRGEAAAKLNAHSAREALKQVEAELQQAPAPTHPVTDETLGDARSKFEDARSQLKQIEDEIQAKRGALQQVGGEVARQKADDAAKELQSAQERERQVETEYQAWALLRETLREAEQEEGTHLGRTLAEPIARRFSDLTAGRYGKLALGPNLETHGIFVAGDDRPVSLLSIGTRDQLSTVFRLTLAEQLKSTVVLDDQLTQSDPGRMLWLRDLLKEVATNIQVIVFTCRPDDYLLSDDGQSCARSVDLVQFIERWGPESRSELPVP
jgi:DNA repair exonuclease SbcCD ATPase subunit